MLQNQKYVFVARQLADFFEIQKIIRSNVSWHETVDAVSQHYHLDPTLLKAVLYSDLFDKDLI